MITIREVIEAEREASMVWERLSKENDVAYSPTQVEYLKDKAEYHNKIAKWLVQLEKLGAEE